MVVRYVKCVTTKPGLFENSSLDFSSAVTIVNGKNGSGKSFMARCLIESIWKSIESPRLLWNTAWDSMFFDVSINLINGSGGDHRYRFTHNGQRFSIASENGTTTELISHDGEDKLDLAGELSKIEKGSQLIRFWHNIDLTSFINCSFVPSPSDLESEEVLHFDTIKKLILSDTSGFYELSGQLKKRIGPDADEGKLTLLIIETTQELKELQKQIELIRIKDMRSLKLEKELQLIRDEQKKLRQQQKAYENDITRLRTITQHLERGEELYHNLENIKEEVNREQVNSKAVWEITEEIKTMYPQFESLYIPDDSNLDRLQELYREIRNLNESIDSFFTRRERKRVRIRRIATGFNIAAVIAAGTIIYKNGFLFEKDIVLLASILGTALFFSPVSLIYTFFSTRNKKLNKLKEERNELEKRLKSLLKESNLVLEDYKMSELFEFLLQYFEDYIEYIERVRERDETEERLLDKKELKGLKEKLKELDGAEKDLKKKIQSEIESLETMDPVGQDNEIVEIAIKKLTKAGERLEGEITIKEKVAERITREISREPGDGTDIKNLEEKAAAVEVKLAALNDRARAVKLVIETLNEAVLRREQQQIAGLVSSALERFHDITGEQYKSTVDDHDVKELIVGNGITGEMNPAVAHALILSVKLSLSEFMPETLVSLPLIIDDPFLFMDDDRTEKLKNQINDIAMKRQVIIFTHKSDVASWGTLIKL